MKLSVVIPSRNRRALLARTLPTVLGQNVPYDEFEVLVVSDGSTDDTAEFIRGIKTQVALRVIERPHRGIGVSRNVGIEAARSELVLMLDDDMVCEPTLIGEHIAAHSSQSACVVVGSMLVSPESRTGLATELVRASHQSYREALTGGRALELAYKTWLATNFSAPRSLLMAHHGYDERFPSSEDQDLAIRLWQAGVQFKFLPDPPTLEIYSKSGRQVVSSDAPRVGAGDVQICRKHPEYRRMSLAAQLIGSSRARLWGLWLCCAPPFSPEPMLRIPYRLAERFASASRIRNFGIRLLHYRKSIASMRSAMREVGSWAAMRREFGTMLPVLRYHHVGTVGVAPNPALAVAPDRFESHVRWLAQRGYAGIAPSEWLAWVKEGKALPERPVLIAFDECYADNAEFALPILHRFGFRAGVYAATHHIGGRAEWDLEWGIVPRRMMSEDQMRCWARQGIEFGANGRTHKRLTMLSGDQLAEEIEGSANDLDELLGSRPVSFAYPYGAVNPAVVEQVRKSFELALGYSPGLNGLSTDLHLMRTASLMSSDGTLPLTSAVLLGRPSLFPSRSSTARGKPYFGQFGRRVEV